MSGIDPVTKAKAKASALAAIWRNRWVENTHTGKRMVVMDAIVTRKATVKVILQGEYTEHVISLDAFQRHWKLEKPLTAVVGNGRKRSDEQRD